MSFTVYKSSAGSGKTYNLVKEYLKLILVNPTDFRKILAITFTNKAAEDMKNRIIETLLQFINYETLPPKEKEKTQSLTKNLVEILKTEEITILKNAQKALELILHNYSDFAVSTIDSFVYGIVKTFAKDLYIPLNFDVELDENVLLNQAIDLLISRVGNDKDITNLLVRFIETQVDDQRSLNIEEEIRKIGKYLFKEESIINIEKLKELKVSDFFEILSHLFAVIKQNEDILKNIAQKAYQLIEANNISPKAFYFKDKGIYTYFKNIAALKTDSIPNKNIAKGVDSDKWTSDVCTAEEGRAIQSIKDQLTIYYNEIQDFAANELKFINLYHLMARNIFPLAVLDEIASIIEDIKRENNILHISEFNKKIASIVMNEPIPFIYERTGERFKHFMIDEFQDTSVLQWYNLLPLLENALSENGFTMVVGDGKQAIYRWRDGEVEQFINLPYIKNSDDNPLLSQKEEALKRNYIEIELKQNFRSFTQIIDFNNDFFKTITKVLPDIYQKIYNDAAQLSDKNKPGGYVQIDFIDEDPDFSFEELTLNKLLEIVEDLTLDKHYAASDIAVLCCSNKNANAIARFLIENNIEVVSSESLLLYKSPLIIFIITVLEYISNKDNIVAAVNIVNYLIKTNAIENVSLTEMLHNVTDDESFLNHELKKYFHEYDYFVLKNTSLYDLCEEIIRIFRLNNKPDAYLQFFLDVVLTYTVSKKNNITDFLVWWEENADKFSVIVPQGKNAVKVMTIHKSKGLQFPVVIYPFANEKKKLSKNNLWIDIDDKNFPKLKTFLIPTNKKILDTNYSNLYDEEENKSRLDLMNILYVVMTRPVEKLFILSEKPGQKSDSITVNNLLKSYLQEKAFWNETEKVYTFGKNAQNSKIISQQAENEVIYDRFISTRWQKKLIMKYKAKDIWNLDANEASLKWGNLIHTAMCSILTCFDVDKTIDVLYNEGFLDSAEKEEVRDKINHFVHHPSLIEFYQPTCEVKNEQEILDANGTTYRPDRIVINPFKTAIIDYKTGSQEANHKTQVDKYAELLSEMGYSNIEKYLIYVDKDLVVEW